MIRSLFGKILTSHIVVLVLLTASIGISLSHLVTNYLVEAKKAELIRVGISTTRFLNAVTQDQLYSPSLLENLSDFSGTTMWIIDQEKHTRSGKAPKIWQHHMQVKNEPDEDLFNGEVTSRLYSANDDDDPAIVVSIPFPQNPSIVLMIHTPITGIAKTSAAIEQLLLYTILGSILLAGIFAFILSRNLTKPISNISHAAEKFTAGNYKSRTNAIGQDEIGRLGFTFNEMAAALERIEQERQEFFSDITHELKTPLATIQAVTESLLDGLVTDKAKQACYLKTTLDECHQMNSLISELLNLARIESGQMNFQYQNLNLCDFIEKQKGKFQPMSAEKNQQLIFSVDPKLLSVKTDPLRIEQILSNLLSNALRHSPDGNKILIQFERDKNNFILSVTDFGEGIPKKDLPYLWDRFYRVDKARSRNKGGTGLGLAITKKLVEGMHGSISVSSIPNEKTIFKVIFPQMF